MAAFAGEGQASQLASWKDSMLQPATVLPGANDDCTVLPSGTKCIVWDANFDVRSASVGMGTVEMAVDAVTLNLRDYLSAESEVTIADGGMINVQNRLLMTSGGLVQGQAPNFTGILRLDGGNTTIATSGAQILAKMEMRNGNQTTVVADVTIRDLDIANGCTLSVGRMAAIRGSAINNNGTITITALAGDTIVIEGTITGNAIDNPNGATIATSGSPMNGGGSSGD